MLTLSSVCLQRCYGTVLPITKRGSLLAPIAAYSKQYATVTNLDSYPRPGERLYGFTLKRTKYVPELQLAAFYLQHDTTGADYLHIARDDKNNVFSIGFKTNPPDDTGVPHILEHTTLCGSERYRPELKLG